MNVLLVSTSEQSGGGAIAAKRLMEALNKNGVKARLMVRDKQSDAVTVCRVGCKLPKLLERLTVLLYLILSWFRKISHSSFKSWHSRLWQIDISNVGIDITRTREFREADIIHLHWVCQGMLSIDGIARIMNSGKRVIWTLHDEWPYLGVCHYRGECKEAECRHCPLISGSLPATIYSRKHSLYQHCHPTFVGCSQWITNQARLALPSGRVEHINNCIPSALFCPTDMHQARLSLSLPQDKRLLLFCSQNVTDERKGIIYLSEALEYLSAEDLHIVIVGKNAEKIPLPDKFGTTLFGSISEREMPMLYNAVDAFVTPSLQDNLPNTIAEAMSCGTPCVGFDVGGIPEMIDHLENGYVARYRDARDLAEGIRFVICHDLRAQAHSKALAAYGETHVAQKYIDLYINNSPTKT